MSREDSGLAQDRAGSARTSGLPGAVGLIKAYLVANVSMEVEYGASFAARVFSMLINDCMWLVFWIFYFDRFPVVRGWGRQDVVWLWSLLATGYGFGVVFFGNASNLARLIARGELDVYLTQPKSVLLHVLISRSVASGWGDVGFGLIVFALLGEPTPVRCLLFAYGALLSGVFHTCFVILAQSLAFFIGNSETFASQLSQTIVHFSTYPTAIYDGWIKIILFTVIPAGFISYLPIGLMRSFSWPYVLGVTAAAAGFIMLSVLVFRAGLRRYESGNLVVSRL